MNSFINQKEINVELDERLIRKINISIENNPGVQHKRNLEIQGIRLKPMPISQVRVGLAGGLPYDFLSTDIYSGCLPISSLCYGNCPQGLLTIEQGYNFGDRKLNVLDDKILEQDLSNLSLNQKWIRQGWNSDISFHEQGWQNALKLGEIAKNYERVMVYLTKIFSKPSTETLERFVEINAEIRVSISALDNKDQLEKRLVFLKEYRSIGGVGIPYLMTALYGDETLNFRQKEIVRWITENDFPGSEHPLRLNDNNPLISLFDISRAFPHPKFQYQKWFGNLYPNILLMPAPPSLKPQYSGIGSNKFSEIDWESKLLFFDQGNPSYESLRDGTADLKHPNLHRHGTLPLIKEK